MHAYILHQKSVFCYESPAFFLLCATAFENKNSVWHWVWHKWQGIMHWIRNRRQKIYEKSVDAYGMDKQMLCRFCVTKLENESATERLFER